MKLFVIVISLIVLPHLASIADAANCESIFTSAKRTVAKTVPHAEKMSDELRTWLQTAEAGETINSVVFLAKRSAVTRITRDFEMMAVASNFPSGDRLGFVHTIRAGDVALLSPRFVSKAMILKLIARKTVLKIAIESNGYLDRLAMLPETAKIEGATVLFKTESDVQIATEIIESMGGVVRDYFGTTFFVDMPAGSLLKIAKLPDVDGISF